MSADGPRRYHDRVRLETSHDGRVAWLVMERGEGSANAFEVSMVDAMVEALVDLPDRVGCLVLRGDREFSVGADLSVVKETPADLRPATLETLAAASNRFIRDLRDLDPPTVAAVNGTAAGGGLGFALACDVVVMHEDAVLDPAYARIGLTPDNGNPFFLARTLGPYRARELLLNPRPVDAAEAHDLGLSSRTFEGDPESFDREVGAFAAEFARVPSSVHAVTNSLIDEAYTDSLDDHLERERVAIKGAASSPVFDEGLEAFFERRDPEWASVPDEGEPDD